MPFMDIINLMSGQGDTLYMLKPYGLSEDEGRIYLYLLKYGYSSVLNISRALKIGRTRSYRLLEKLKILQLVDTKLDDRGMKFGASDPSKLKQIISLKENEISRLKSDLPNVLNQLKQINISTQSNSKVLYYTGIEGLKQVTFNLTKAEKLIRVFEVDHLANFLPEDFSEMIRNKLVESKIKTHDLTNKISFPDFTKVSEMIKSYSEFRHIPKVKLSIDFEILIYNDVYATYTYKENDIFCVEIYNQQLAAMQKQIFDFIWSQASEMIFTSPYGSSKLKSSA